MINEKISLKEVYGLKGGVLETICMEYPWDQQGLAWRRPAVIVVPGGAYSMVSRREAEPIANAFLARGFQAFVLTYLCRPDEVAYPEELMQLGCAVDYVKKNAEKYGVNPSEVFVVGFSAGGHLAGDLAVEYASLSEKVGKEIDAKPTAAGLGYPVISNKYGYQGTHDNILYPYTDEAREELLKTLNLDEAVTEQTAPCFLWTTADDALVPAENTLQFALALAKNNVKYELHIYPFGPHGGADCSFEINQELPFLKRNARWLDDCSAFFHIFCEEKF